MQGSRGWLGPAFLDRQPDEEHRAAWEWLGQQLQPYPPDRFIAPLRPRGAKFRTRDLAAADLTCDDDDPSGTPRPRLFWLATTKGSSAVQLTGGERDAQLLADLLFTHAGRGRIVGLYDGARRSLHVLTRWYWRGWVQLGFKVKPIARGTELLALVVSKGRHAWYLADIPSMTGLADLDADGFIATFSLLSSTGRNLPENLCLALQGYQDTIQRHFGVSMRLTVGMTAMAAAARHIPDDAWLWRPPVGLVALCRAGGAFRGGYVWYPPTRGRAHKLDIRRAYSWALSQELPVSAAIGRCVQDGVERPGIYVCRVRGPGSFPVYLGVWRGQGVGFRRQLWDGDECLAILPSAEFAGLRALGYQVQPGWGYVWRQTFSLQPFVQLLEQLLAEHGPDSPQGMVAKIVGNAVYGKMAEQPERLEMAFSADPPGQDWLPFTDAAGDEVADLWSRQVMAYRSHQHVDVAAVVTAHVRTRLYHAMAALTAASIRVLAADTDGLLCSADPRPAVPCPGLRAGDWRYEGQDDVVIAGPRFYTFRGGVRIAGTSPQPAEVVAIAHDRGTVTVEGRVMAPPWQDGAMVRRVERRLRRAAGSDPPSSALA